MKISDIFSGASGDVKPVEDKPSDAAKDAQKAEGDAQAALDQQQISDQQKLDDIARVAESTDVKKDTDDSGKREGAHVSFKGSSCGAGHGCSGSTWCYGSGDFR